MSDSFEMFDTRVARACNCILVISRLHSLPHLLQFITLRYTLAQHPCVVYANICIGVSDAHRLPKPMQFYQSLCLKTTTL